MPANFDKWGPIIGGSGVLSLWVWLAVQTTRCLRVIAIPYKRRTVWLIKILALVVGASGVVGILLDAKIPWLLAAIPGAVIVLVAIREPVADIIPPKPIQDASAYESAWQEYRRLRRVSLRWGLLPLTACLVVFFIFVIFGFGKKLPDSAWSALIAIWFTVLVALSLVASVREWKWYHWPCPRCGCSFRGVWRWWLPKHCVYCGLPREKRK